MTAVKTTVTTTTDHLITLDEGEQFEVPKRFGTKTFRVHGIAVSIEERSRSSNRYVEVRVFGPRVVKAGAVGAPTSERYWHMDEVPEQALRAIKGAGIQL